MGLRSWLERWVLCAVSLLGACEVEPAQGAPERGACVDGQSYACPCGAGGQGSQSCVQGSLGACVCEQTAGALTTNGLPCAVNDVLRAACWSCHGQVLQYTAPMHLVSYADFVAPSPSNPSLRVYQQVQQRVHHATSPMPPPPNARLSSGQLDALDRWINSGVANFAPASCDGGGTPGELNPGDDGIAGAGGRPPDVGGEEMPRPPDDPPPVPDDQECYELTAHASGSDQPYPVGPNTIDSYMNFTFDAPWDTSTPIQAVSFRSVVTNTKVVHHWLLYQRPDGGGGGNVAPGNGTHGSEELLAGWAPGAPDMVLPADVGMTLGKGFTVEIHYNNASGAAEQDASGVQICLTRALRPNNAGLHWLGTESIYSFAGGDVSGTCTPRTDMGPITIIRSWPHMHLKGTHFKTVINRDGGGTETLHDAPFDFNTQLAYDTPAVIMPGDTLTTTCTYNSPAMYGSGTNAEMCYNFMLAYPSGALSSAQGGFGTSATSTNRCLE